MDFEDDFIDDINRGIWTAVKFLAAIVVVLLAVFFLIGCSTIGINTPNGSAHYTRIGNQDISGLRFERDNLGVMRVTLDKQSSDSDVLNLIRQLVTK